MLTVAVCWGLLLCGSALTLNAAAVAALLNSWHLYRGGGWKWRRRNPPSAVVVGEREATGYIVFLFALACNILFVVRILIIGRYNQCSFFIVCTRLIILLIVCTSNCKKSCA